MKYAGLIALVFCPAVAWAEVDGPDFYRITGEPGSGPVSLYAEADAASEVLVSVPPFAGGLPSLGCVGQLSYAEWSVATDQDREEASANAWCKTEFMGVSGWTPMTILAEGTAPLQPSFDCKKAESDVEPAICVSPELAALDLELSRIYALARNGPNISADRKSDLTAYQRGW